VDWGDLSPLFPPTACRRAPPPRRPLADILGDKSPTRHSGDSENTRQTCRLNISPPASCKMNSHDVSGISGVLVDCGDLSPLFRPTACRRAPPPRQLVPDILGEKSPTRHSGASENSGQTRRLNISPPAPCKSKSHGDSGISGLLVDCGDLSPLFPRRLAEGLPASATRGRHSWRQIANPPQRSQRKLRTNSPPYPFPTSTLQYEIAQRFRYFRPSLGLR